MNSLVPTVTTMLRFNMQTFSQVWITLFDYYELKLCLKFIGLEHAFNKYTTTVDTLGTPYDYQSLLHYGKDYFTSNGQPTLVPKDPTAVIGQRNNLSSIDIQEVQLYYQCIGPSGK